MRDQSTLQKAAVALLILSGALALVFPGQFVLRAIDLSRLPAENIPLIHALGLALVATGLAVATERKAPDGRGALLACAGVTVLTLLVLVALTMRLSNWWIDDAGITFSYSRSLSEGLGLVAQPWLPPEEGYSSSVWMLFLAAAARLGADIPMTAKYAGIGFSALSLLIASAIVARETRSPLAVLICGIAIACSPTAVWAASGQEHAMQALLLLGVMVCAYLLDAWRWPAAILLAILVLTRPETPIIVIAVFVTAVLLTRRAGGPLINAGDLAIAILPFIAFVGLIGFRYTYFGDLMPNPYYAKSEGTSITGLFNPLGGGWDYILSGLRDTALIMLLPLAFLIRFPRLPDWVAVGAAVLAGHVFFVIWAKGDWMSQYRFVMPMVPIAVLLLSLGLRGIGGRGIRQGFGVVAMLILMQSTIMQLGAFAVRPTTPMAVVTEVGDNFRTLADRLDIADPLLAHHDAGGISYHRMIRLADLGGLVNRTIGKHMDDRDFLVTYLLDELKPDFFFGARNFAASSGFAETEAFDRAYVRLEFKDMPRMSSYLTHVRRDRIEGLPETAAIRNEAGELVGVRIDITGPEGVYGVAPAD